MSIPISTVRLIKKFGNSYAVSSVSLNIEPGTVYGLLGRNGAGKTTLLRLILGVLNPNTGDAKVFGKYFASQLSEERQRIAYIGQEYRFYNTYTLQEFINITAPLYKRWNWDKADKLLELFDLGVDKRLGEMSGGQRQKVAMLVAFSCGAELLVLDEPASALDPISRRVAMGEMMNFISENPEKNTIIFSTHIVNDLERVATKVGMMDKGKITHEFELDSIHDSMRKVQIVFHDTIPDDFSLSTALSEVRNGKVITAVFDIDNDKCQEELDRIRNSNATIKEFPVNLEEFFVQIYGASEYTTVE